MPYATVAWGGQPLSQQAAENATPVQASGIFPAWVINTVFDVLPDPSTQVFALTQELRWNAALVTAGRGVVLTAEVPQKYAYILTDVFYYALAPSSLLAGPAARLTTEQLAGLIHFELRVSGRTPIKDDTSLVDPYTAAAAASGSGWPLLEQPFGPQRNGRFAVYARSGQTVEIRAVIDSAPRFMLTKLGAHVHGYSVPETTFEDIFRRPRL